MYSSQRDADFLAKIICLPGQQGPAQIMTESRHEGEHSNSTVRRTGITQEEQEGGNAQVAESNGRGDRIRTCDILLPKQARYRAALRPDSSITMTYIFPGGQIRGRCY